jgi:hypothetical protein
MRAIDHGSVAGLIANMRRKDVGKVDACFHDKRMLVRLGRNKE